VNNTRIRVYSGEQEAALHRVVKADVSKQLETAQKAHEAAKAAAIQWCLQPTPQVHPFCTLFSP
jgi:hypothetical protein